MTGQTDSKLNSLLTELGDGWLAPSSWLAARGFSRSLLAHYVQRGWLRSPARGVFLRAGSQPSWQTAVFSLQQLAGLPLHPGGRSALALHGLDHYLRPGPADVSLYGPVPLPAWLARVGLAERFHSVADRKLGLTRFTPEMPSDPEALREAGFVALPGDRPDAPLVASLPERAILELLLLVPQAATAAEADALLQGMTRVRPDLMSDLLRRCASVKVKRLFLALAERHRHAWFEHLDLRGVDLGTGKRLLAPGERLHPKYGISLPRDLDEQLG